MIETLFSLLSSAVFLNSGTVTSNDSYIYQPIDCLYLEAENVSQVQDYWGSPWGGPCLYMYKVNGTIPPPLPCLDVPTEPGKDRQGGDYAATPNYTSVIACQTACCTAAQCAAFVWVPQAPSSFMDCKQGQPCCFLKSSAPSLIASSIPGIVAGSKDPYYNVSVTVPPSGMRSAVPLGGIGAGSFELRADGTVHEWIVHNAGPASSAKLGVIGDMMLGVRVLNTQSGEFSAKLLRTGSLGSASASPYADGVDAITYSGSYPLSKLTIHEPEFAAVSDLSLYAYSRFVPGNLNASATPAVTFSLTASNPSTESLNVSLFLSLPLPALNDCYGTTGGPGNVSQASTAAACLHQCAASPSCDMWTWEADKQRCTQMSGVPLIAYRAGWACGINSLWKTDNNNLVLTQMPNACSFSNPSPLCGSYAVSTINSTASLSFGSGDALSDLWSDFYKAGSFSGVSQASNAAYGVASATIALAPGQSATTSLVFSWYLPYRDYLGKTLGTFYANLYESVNDVANELSQPEVQHQMVSDINDHHNVWAGPNRSEPDWLADVAINSFSHMRNTMFFKDGRWCQFEAFDCDDVDPVHNDFQRHLPYLWAFPEVEVQKSRAWASFATPEGMIQENFASGGLGPPGTLDGAGGRAMSDVTSIWAIGVLELYQTGAMTLADVNTLWPSVVKGFRWQLSQCKNPAAPDLPAYLVCTYDIEVLEKYPATAYNSFIHLAMMKSVAALAEIVGDEFTVNEATTAFNVAALAIRNQLWNSNTKSFRAYSKFNATMSDSLYGIAIAHSLGLGLLWNSSTDLLNHLSYERKTNQDDFGLQVLVGREVPSEIPGIDTSHWGMAGPTYSYVSIAAGNKDIDAALNATKLYMDNYRSRVNDQWNLAGLTTSANWASRDHDNGQSWCTSHYGMPLTHYYVHYVLSGLQVNVPAGTVTLDPVYQAPFSVPLLLAGTTGIVSQDRNGRIQVSIKFGSLSLPAGGLVVVGRPYMQAVRLTKGQSISWS